MSEQLNIRFGGTGQTIELGMVEQLAEHLRGAFRELARERGNEGKIQVSFDVMNASNGSLILDLQPRVLAAEPVDVDAISATLIADINSLATDGPRPTMSSGALQQYRALIEIARSAGGMQVRHRGVSASLDANRQVAFRAALKEQKAVGTVVVGTIETVNIHVRPWRFGLYTKLDRDRIECLFEDAYLDQVLNLMERKAMVEVTGEALFGPAGATPRLIQLDQPPVALDFDPDKLRAFRRSVRIVEPGETAVSAVERIRAGQAVVA